MNGAVNELLGNGWDMKTIYVSSYVPRPCGIATYTKDLTHAMNLLSACAPAEIMAIHRDGESEPYPLEVKFAIEEQDPSSYVEAATYVNHSSADLVVIQHEFGLYGGHCGQYIVRFAELMNKPVVVTCHTIIEDPASPYAEVFRHLANRADALIVMMQDSADKLESIYHIPCDKIAVIPHGTPDLCFARSSAYKIRKGIGVNRLVLGNINLLSPNKGIEYAIEAMAEIVKAIPDALYVVVGQTHPVKKKESGEEYRGSLQKMVRDLGLVRNVRFVDEYVSLEELINWLRAMDMYITPYIDRQQSSSGALAYAVGAGKLCISTPYLYAKEVLADGKGVLVPFRDSKAIADAVIENWRNQEQMTKYQEKAYECGRAMTWTSVALRHLDLYSAVLREVEYYEMA